jgi:hypothetical protein
MSGSPWTKDDGQRCWADQKREDVMNKHVEQSFTDQAITIDGDEYIGCTFTRCQLIFTGGSIPLLTGNTFNGCQWIFDEAASRTIQFMSALYSGGHKSLIEDTIKGIRGKSGIGLKTN